MSLIEPGFLSWDTACLWLRSDAIGLMCICLAVAPPPPPNSSPLLRPVGDFSEHVDQLPSSRGDGVDSPDTTSASKASGELGTATLGLPRSDTQDKSPSPASAGKVPKSVSASALSLMIPGGERAFVWSDSTKWGLKQNLVCVYVESSLLYVSSCMQQLACTSM